MVKRWIGGTLVAALAAIGFTSEDIYAADSDPAVVETELDFWLLAVVVGYFGFTHEHYPGTQGTLITGAELAESLSSPFAERIPRSDAWGNPIFYATNGRAFAILSYGPDGEPDEDYDFANDGEIWKRSRSQEMPRTSGDDLFIVELSLMHVDMEKRALSDLRTIGTAIEGFVADNGHYPGPTSNIVEVEHVRLDLEPAYIRDLPLFDPWGNPILFWSDGKKYFVLSRGSDGLEDHDYSGPLDPETHRETTEPSEDIVFADGRFVQLPKGFSP